MGRQDAGGRIQDLDRSLSLDGEWRQRRKKLCRRIANSRSLSSRVMVLPRSRVLEARESVSRGPLYRSLYTTAQGIV